jgi:hypothetical protein
MKTTPNKKLQKFSFFILLLIVSCCSKDDEQPPKPVTEIDKLPPATQIGAEKVGCLFDGKAFLPESNNTINCFYQLVSGDYYFSMSFGNTNSNSIPVALGVGAKKLQIAQGVEYNLYEFADGNTSGSYFNGFDNFTSQENTGKLYISKLDFTNNIVSGTFWYDIKDNFGVLHQIREGRFDLHFTQ